MAHSVWVTVKVWVWLVLAINTLIGWYRRGIDVEKHLPELSTYLGHTHISDTYWYLTATPQLLRQALRRVEGARGRQRP